jgi:Tol biopolymer transport system component
VLDTPRNIYLVNPDGSGENRLTNTSDFKQVVSIAPDGKAIVFTRVTESTQSQRLYLQGTRSPTQFAISENICTQTTSAVCGWGAITWTADGLKLAFHQFQRPRPGQTGQSQNNVYLTTRAGSSTTTELLTENGTSPWWLAGSPYLLIYTPALSGGAPVPHAMDSRNAQRYPLTGAGEDATIYDWRYAPEP